MLLHRRRHRGCRRAELAGPIGESRPCDASPSPRTGVTFAAIGCTVPACCSRVAARSKFRRRRSHGLHRRLTGQSDATRRQRRRAAGFRLEPLRQTVRTSTATSRRCRRPHPAVCVARAGRPVRRRRRSRRCRLLRGRRSVALRGLEKQQAHGRRRRVYVRGGVVGGGSAGLAIQGAVIFDSVAADRFDVETDTADAVAFPFEKSISFTTGLFSWPALSDTITDTHFVVRNRFGRTVVFLARIIPTPACRRRKRSTVSASIRPAPSASDPDGCDRFQRVREAGRISRSRHAARSA